MENKKQAEAHIKCFGLFFCFFLFAMISAISRVKSIGDLKRKTTYFIMEESKEGCFLWYKERWGRRVHSLMLEFKKC
ncbi:hypothetical protein [Peribacillus sp. NPDC097295]|uniref:hypothetical protein n=1 Tax=Peribacillus sp. NPDC097295 TaxID=3364402 RepID=UPI003828EE2D